MDVEQEPFIGADAQAAAVEVSALYDLNLITIGALVKKPCAL